MKQILIIKNGVCDVDKSIQQIIHTIDKNIKTYVATSYNLVHTSKATDYLFYDAIIICGGQQSLTNRCSENYPYQYLNKIIEYTKIWIESNMCVLGICLGGQIIGEACGFKTSSLDTPVMGYQKDIRLDYSPSNALLDETFTDYLPFLMCCHYDFTQINEYVNKPNFNIDAYLSVNNYDSNSIIPYAFSIKNAYAVQFHPEMNDDLLRQVKYFYPSLENVTQFAISNREIIHKTTLKFFDTWIKLFLNNKN
jgi:GMP synthase-like glutamine amidotransferase